MSDENAGYAKDAFANLAEADAAARRDIVCARDHDQGVASASHLSEHDRPDAGVACHHDPPLVRMAGEHDDGCIRITRAQHLEKLETGESGKVEIEYDNVRLVPLVDVGARLRARAGDGVVQVHVLYGVQ